MTQHVCNNDITLRLFRFVLSLIMANLMSAVVSVPGHVYQLLMIADDEALLHRSQGVGTEADSVNCGVPWLEQASKAANDERDSSTSLDTWYWHQQGLDGLTVLVSLASVLSILLISLDRYYVRLAKTLAA